MELFIFDFTLPIYEEGFDSYRKVVKDNAPTIKKDKPINAPAVLRQFINEGYFKKAQDTASEKTLSIIVADSKQRFRPDFESSEFSSALRYASRKNGPLKRYSQNGSGPYVYHANDDLD